MKYIILVLGLVFIFIWVRTRNSYEVAMFSDFILPICYLIYVILWLVVFFVFDLELPKIRI